LQAFKEIFFVRSPCFIPKRDHRSGAIPEPVASMVRSVKIMEICPGKADIGDGGINYFQK
jgi:hypothetical protein